MRKGRGLLITVIAAVIFALLFFTSLPILLGRETSPEARCVINEVVLR